MYRIFPSFSHVSWHRPHTSSLRILSALTFIFFLSNCRLAPNFAAKQTGGREENTKEIEDALVHQGPADADFVYEDRNLFSMEGMTRRCLANRSGVPTFTNCDSSSSSLFNLVFKADGQSEIISQENNGCLDAVGTGSLRFNACSESTSQNFVINTYSYPAVENPPRFAQIKHAASNMCLERVVTSTGSEGLVLKSCSDSPAQFFISASVNWKEMPKGLPRGNEFMFGIYTYGNWTPPGGVKDTGGVDGGWNAVEPMIDHKIPSILWYNNIVDPFSGNDYFIKDNFNQGHNRSYQFGFMPMTGEGKSLVREVINGQYDDVLFNYFIEAKASAMKYNTHYYFRFASEMNGDWTPWGGAKNPCDVPGEWGICANASAEGSQNYVKMWKRVYSIARTVDSRRKFISFVWSPVPTSYPNEAWNHMDRYYPGDQYTDWVGLSYYSGNPGDKFGLDYFYERYTIKKPAMFSEGGSSVKFCKGFNENGPYTDTWTEPFFNDLETKYTRFSAFYWFNISKECEWKFTDQQNTRDIIKEILKNPRYTETPF